MTNETVKQEQEASFDGLSIVKSAKYKRYADILCHALDEGELYTHKQIDAILAKTMKQPVCKAINPEVN